MKMLTNEIFMKSVSEKRLSILLWLIAVHSFIVGVGLIVMPAELMEYLGFNPTIERFFPSQGGVFHIAMSVAYALPAFNIKKFEQLIRFSIIVKVIATLFLFTYYFFFDPILLILFSGITDFMMAITLYIIFTLYKGTINKGEVYV